MWRGIQSQKKARVNKLKDVMEIHRAGKGRSSLKWSSIKVKCQNEVKLRKISDSEMYIDYVEESIKSA